MLLQMWHMSLHGFIDQIILTSQSEMKGMWEVSLDLFEYLVFLNSVANTFNS